MVATGAVVAMGATRVTDDELLGRWRTGDVAAGEALFARYFAMMYRYFRSKCAAEADDLVQATFCACLQAQQRFRGDAAFRTYLFTIARHELYRVLRERRRTWGRSSAELTSLPESSPAPPIFACDQDRRRLVRLLDQLPPAHRTVLELHYWDELEIEVLGKQLGAPAVTIRSRLHRARKLLRELLEKDRRSRARGGGPMDDG
jgi:RNA polymerase sigma-70 factor (ECF subfamily)